MKKCEKCLKLFNPDNLNCPRCGYPAWGELRSALLGGFAILIISIFLVYFGFTDKSGDAIIRIVVIAIALILMFPGSIVLLYYAIKALGIARAASKVPREEIRYKVKGKVYIKVQGGSEIVFQYFERDISDFIRNHNCTVAENEETADFIIQCDLHTYQVGRYQSGANAYKVECVIKIIDNSTAEAFSESRFYGGDPPKYTTSRGGIVTGGIPDTEIKSFLLEYL